MKMKRSFWRPVEGGGAGDEDKMRLTMNAIAENEYFAQVTVVAFFGKNGSDDGRIVRY